MTTPDRSLQTVTLTVSVPQEVALAAKAGARRAVLPVFPAGEPKMNDDRTVCFEEKDRSDVVAAFSRAKTPLAVLYDHGKGARGGLAAGRLLRLIERADGGLDAEAALTPRAAREIADGEWFATSAKFRAWRDEKGRLRPAELRHLALVPEPAIDGMGEIALLSAEDSEEPTDDVITEPGTTPAPEPNPAPAAAAAGTTPSPDEASQTKEQGMPDTKSTPAPGSAAGGTGEPDPKKTTVEASADSGKLTEVELAAKIDEMVTSRVGKALDDLNRKRRVADLVEMSAQGGKTTVAQRTPSEKLGKLSPAERLAAADPDAFEEFCRLAPAVAPVNGLRFSGRASDVQLSEQSFSADDLSDPSRRADLMAAAQELAAKDKVEIDVALSRLIGVAN